MKVAVVGLGYVGLPLAITLSLSNFKVTGIDKKAQNINLLKRGQLPFAKNEPGLLKFFQKAITRNNLKFSQSFDELQDSKVIFICVDTPTRDTKPDNSSLIAAAKNIAKSLQKGQVVVVESTVAPKTTLTIVAPILEKYSPAKLKVNRDFYLATAPERVRPNYIFKQLTTLSRTIGISSPKIQKLLQSIYSKITSGQLDFTDSTTAEVVKTVENAYRDVQIAFANEIALACEALGVDVWRVRDLVNKSPFRQMHEPGSGVGGHCLPKDPWLLYASVKTPRPKLIKSARQINDSMPKHIFELVTQALDEKKITQKAQIAILGYSYVKNTDDTRNSPSQSLVSILKENNISYRIHDPHVEKYSKKNPYEIAKNSDCLVLMVDHDDYLKLNLEKLAKITRHQILIDGRNFFRRKTAERLGFLYKGIGNV